MYVCNSAETYLIILYVEELARAERMAYLNSNNDNDDCTCVYTMCVYINMCVCIYIYIYTCVYTLIAICYNIVYFTISSIM